MMDTSPLRAEICRLGRVLYERGHAPAGAGSISVRLPGGEGLLITPAEASLGQLEAQGLAHVGGDGRQLGGYPFSRCLALHQRIYGADAHAHCIIATRSRQSVALSLLAPWQEHEALPPLTPYFVIKVGHVPPIRYHRPDDAATVEAVAAAMLRAQRSGTPIRAVLLERIGPVVWQASPAAALAVLEELEETAGLWLRTEPRPRPLSEAQIDELRQHLGARW